MRVKLRGWRGKQGWLPHTAKIQLESAGCCPPTASPPCFYRIHTAATTHSAATGCWFRRSARSARGRAGKCLCQALRWPATPVTAICARATSAPTAIAPARSPPLEMEFAQRLAAPEAVFETIPELEFDQTANLRAEAGHNRLVHIAGVDAEPILELEFDQTLGW